MKNQRKSVDKGLRRFYSYHKMMQIFATVPQRPTFTSSEPHLLPPTLFFLGKVTSFGEYLYKTIKVNILD